jgi:DNA-directed RNA polymerase specialized sigma24 family protein
LSTHTGVTRIVGGVTSNLASSDLEALAAEVVAAKLPPPGTRRRILEQAGVSYRDLAAVLDTTPMTVMRWVHGTVEPRTRRDRAKLREALERLEEAAQ